MLADCPGHNSDPSGMPEPGLNPDAVSVRAAISHSCLSILVSTGLSLLPLTLDIDGLLMVQPRSYDKMSDDPRFVF